MPLSNEQFNEALTRVLARPGLMGKLAESERLDNFIVRLKSTEFCFVEGQYEDFFDKDKAPKYVIYLTRSFGDPKQYQYITFTSYDGKFVEATLFVYEHPFNSRAKKKQLVLYCNLFRNFDEILEAVGKTYTLPEERKTK